MRSLWTLTYADEPADRRQVVRHLRDFFEAVRICYGRLPLIAVIEVGTVGGRLHVHFAANRWLPRRSVAALWGRGWVHVRGPRPTAWRWGVAHLARYLAKYVAKSVDDDDDGDAADRSPGEHRYLVTQGHQPTAWTWRAHHADYLWALADRLMGPAPTVIAIGEEPGAIVWGWWLSWPDD